jgi:uncharacterized membrane protein
MAERWHFILVLAAALGSGLVAGVFYAFSTFVMRALARLAPAQGIAAMKSINAVVINPWFLGVFIGTAALSLAAVASAISRWGSPGAAWLLAGGILYFAGSFVVTMRGNVPMNEALALVDAESAAGVEYWQRYVAGWTRWNHVRTAASLVASLSYIFVLAG